VIQRGAQARHDGGERDEHDNSKQLRHGNVQFTRKATPVPMPLSFGTRRFSPPLGLTALMLVLCVVFIALGRWQWRRGNLHAAEHASFERGARKVLALDT
jgi:hypothetical protein